MFDLSFLRGIFGKKSIPATSPDPATKPTSSPIAPALPVAPQQPSLHLPLVAAMKSFPGKQMPKGRILYHGSRELSPHTNFAGKQLLGTRKWFSENPVYASNYAFYDSGPLGAHLIWVCRLADDLDGIQGSQSSLAPHSPWGNSFPWNFPDSFGQYIGASHGIVNAAALFDHQNDGLFEEILIANHSSAIDIIDVEILPNSTQAAAAATPGIVQTILKNAGIT